MKFLEQSEKIQDAVSFPGDQKLTYSLQLSDEFRATFRNNQLIVSIPRSEGNHWMQTEAVGLERAFPLQNGNELRLLIEKDFKCLSDRPNEDESDAFPNKTMEVC